MENKKQNEGQKPVKVAEFAPLDGDETFYHVEVERTHFDPATGQKLSTPIVVKLTAKDYENYVKVAESRLGYKTKILYTPKI